MKYVTAAVSLCCGVAIATSVCAQTPMPPGTTDSTTQEILVACVPKDGKAAPLTLESLSARDVTLTSVSPLGDRPLDFVWVNGFDGFGFQMLKCCMRPDVDRASVIGAEGYTGKPDEVKDWVARRLEDARHTTNADLANPDRFISLITHDALLAGIKKLDQISRGGPKIMLVSGSFWIEETGPSRDALFLKELSRQLLLHRVHMLVWDVTDPLFGDPGYLDDPSEASGGWQSIGGRNSRLATRTVISQLSRLFKSWYIVRVQTPPATKKDQFLKWKPRTTAACKLTAPSDVVIPAKK